MEKDIKDIFTNVVAKHLHNLKELIEDSKSEKVLVHEWVLGIEKNWSVYRTVSDEGGTSEFIVRLSFRIGGMRDEFFSYPTKERFEELLIETLDISTFCFFEFGAREDIAELIEHYCHEVDEYIGRKLLIPRFIRFKLSKEAIPLINIELEFLKRFGNLRTERDIKISKNTRDASSLEKDLLTIFKGIISDFTDIITEHLDYTDEIHAKLNTFLDKISEFGYKSLADKKQRQKIEEIVEQINIKKKVKEILTESFEGLLRIDSSIAPASERNEFKEIFSNKLFGIDVKRVHLNLYSILKDVLIKNPDSSKIFELIERIFNKSMSNFKENYLEEKKREIGELKKHYQLRQQLKAIVNEAFNKMKDFEPDLPEPSKQKQFEPILGNKLINVDEKEILLSLFQILMEVLKRNPEQGDKAIDVMEQQIKAITESMKMYHIQKKLKEIQEMAYLKIKVVNLLRRPKKDVNITVLSSGKKIVESKTNNYGEVIFDNLKRTEISIKIGSKKEKIIDCTLNKYYDYKVIWLFQF